MKTLILASLALVSTAAHAGTVVCTGSIQKYDFVITAKTAGEGFVGKATADVKKERKPYKKIVMPIQSGEYNPRLMNIVAKDDKNQAILQAVRSNGGAYVGEVAITGEGAGGETKISVTCQAR